MFRALVFALAFATTPSAYAACANYADGSLDTPAPRAELCYDGACEATTLVMECGTASDALLEYSSGWRFMADAKGYQALKGDEPMDMSLVQCSEADEGACGFLLDYDGN